MSVQEKNFLIVGAGNIGQVLAQRLVTVGVLPAQIAVCDADPARSINLAQRFGVIGLEKLPASECKADVIILATPPKAIVSVAGELAGGLRPGQVVISMAAAVPLDQIRKVLPEGVALARVLPNPPSMLGKGMNPVAFEAETPADVRSLVMELLAVLGQTVEVRDDQMNWCVGLAGAAMRSVLPVVVGMTQAGVEAGLTQSEARLVAAQILLGTASLALETDLSFEQIRALTPMQTLDEAQLAEVFLTAARAAREKASGMQQSLFA